MEPDNGPLVSILTALRGDCLGSPQLRRCVGATSALCGAWAGLRQLHPQGTVAAELYLSSISVIHLQPLGLYRFRALPTSYSRPVSLRRLVCLSLILHL